MKLQIDSEAAVGSGLKKVSEFRMNMNAKAARVLSDTLYQDSHGSIIRELSCNAYDAHCMVGKQDVPFEITLPDRFSPELRIRDFGPGISPEDIENVYCVYFESTKDSDNDAVGAFGLGSKTPFALTDSFMVVSIHKGVKRVYNAYKDQGLPNISEFGDGEETDEPDGLEVIITVKDRDAQIFREKVRSELRFFPVKPKVNGVVWPEITDTLIDVNGFTYFQHDGGDLLRGFFVKIGPVAYPISFDRLREHYTNTNKRMPSLVKFMEGLTRSGRYGNNANKGGYLDMPIGTVEITPSRESLSYSEFTLQNIDTVIEQISDALFDTIKQNLQDKYDEGYSAFRQYYHKLDSMMLESVDPDYIEDNFEPFVINPNNKSLSIKLPENIAQFSYKVYQNFRGNPELARRRDINSGWESQGSNFKRDTSGEIVKDKDGQPVLLPFEESDASRFGIQAIVGSEAPIYIKDEKYAFSMRCFNDFQQNHSGSEYLVIERGIGDAKLSDLHAFFKKYLGDRVKLVSETDKVATKSKGGHSTTGGQTRSWFDIEAGLLNNGVTIDGLYHNTLYTLNAPSEFDLDTDDLEDGYDQNEVVFFTTYNNKLDRPETISNRVLFNYLFNVKDVKVIAIPRNQETKFSKLDSAIHVDEYVKANRQDITDHIAVELNRKLVDDYNNTVERMLRNERSGALALLEKASGENFAAFRKENDLTILAHVMSYEVEPVLEALEASYLKDYYNESQTLLQRNTIEPVEKHFKDNKVKYLSFLDAVVKAKDWMLDEANAGDVLAWGFDKEMATRSKIHDPFAFQPYHNTQNTKSLLNMGDILKEIIGRLS